ncbi:MAG: tetratricopeptide repeat protein [Deltaproteobacteria bacterium]|nr:tetratricopeptide repeat protein [Deltaproteobacteria bacterium]
MTRGARRSDVARATRWLLLAAALGLAGGGCRDGGASPSGSVDAGPVPLPAEADGVTGAQVAETAETAAPTNRRPPETEARGAEDADDGGGDADAYQSGMVRGDAALYSGRFEDARTAYLQALDARPDSMAPALGALRAMVIEGHADARADLAARIRRKIAAYHERPDTWGAGYLLSARLSLALGDTGEALDEARLAVQQMPELGVAWRVLGEAAMAAELWSEAVDALRTAVDLGLAAEAGTWERLADALDEVGATDAAKEAARKAVEKTGTDRHARRRRLNLLAVVLKHAHDLAAAQAAADEARVLGPDDPAVLHNEAVLAEARSRPEEALALYEKALEAAPVPMTAWRMGKLLLDLDRPTEALAAFTKAAANLPRWTWPASTRWWPAYDTGKLYARGGRYKESVGYFEDALREARDAEATREIVSWLGYSRTFAGDPADGPGDAQ